MVRDVVSSGNQLENWRSCICLRTSPHGLHITDKIRSCIETIDPRGTVSASMASGGAKPGELPPLGVPSSKNVRKLRHVCRPMSRSRVCRPRGPQTRGVKTIHCRIHDKVKVSTQCKLGATGEGGDQRHNAGSNETLPFGRDIGHIYVDNTNGMTSPPDGGGYAAALISGHDAGVVPG
jgi:hypothetical protein